MYGVAREPSARRAPTMVASVLRPQLTRKWWTRTERFRTVGRLLADVGFSDPFVIPIYQLIAGVSAAMYDRGARVTAIARRFRVDDHTAAKALRWYRRR